ncbi:MAG: hypothetical protein CMI55_04450 [Parcubacteria group bacterium]|jgi:hypothetical protein|nr:hypothetical protein [Parcubacteria group bacterium]|tara:strand:- start:4290 stop:4520 length:231 start_codon:yes stop_codon:yes gene_type:complete
MLYSVCTFSDHGLIIKNPAGKIIKCNECGKTIDADERYVLPPISFHKLCMTCAVEKIPVHLRLMQNDLDVAKKELE